MLFNSFLFWAFFVAVVGLYWRLGHRAQNRLLLLASYVFYGAWDWRFLSLIWISTIVDYVAGRLIFAEDRRVVRRHFLLLSIITNLGILGVFKYFDFFAPELAKVLGFLGLEVTAPRLEIILPVGISFYTFQTLSYTIDIYRRQTKPVRDFGDFALYVCFFPQLVAGPIERSSRLLPQIRHERQFDEDALSQGLYLVLFGLFKKIVVADNMAVIVNTVFSSTVETRSGVEVLVGVYAFAFQIYGDFSGYSSIARGVARWLGFDLMVNFRMPYLSVSPSDFWRRWHISLSSWLRDYLYIPLGGNRNGAVRTYRNLIITMLLGGLWHGAAWTFVIWGAIHGIILCIFRALGNEEGVSGRREGCGGLGLGRRVAAIILMFHVVCLGWLFFRADSARQAAHLLSLLWTSFDITPFAVGSIGLVVFYVLPMSCYEVWVEKSGLLALTKLGWWPQSIFYTYCLLMLTLFPSPGTHEFIYFQF